MTIFDEASKGLSFVFRLNANHCQLLKLNSMAHFSILSNLYCCLVWSFHLLLVTRGRCYYNSHRILVNWCYDHHHHQILWQSRLFKKHNCVTPLSGPVMTFHKIKKASYCKRQSKDGKEKREKKQKSSSSFYSSSVAYSIKNNIHIKIKLQ